MSRRRPAAGRSGARAIVRSARGRQAIHRVIDRSIRPRSSVRASGCGRQVFESRPSPAAIEPNFDTIEEDVGERGDPAIAFGRSQARGDFAPAVSLQAHQKGVWIDRDVDLKAAVTAKLGVDLGDTELMRGRRGSQSENDRQNDESPPPEVTLRPLAMDRLWRARGYRDPAFRS